jgi:GNAT superfamily N-acetyltransferase
MINIREAKIDEIQKLNDMIALSARELSHGDYSEPEINSAIQYIFGIDTELVNDHTYFVIEKDGEIAGCGGWSKRKTLFGGNQFSDRENTTTLLDPLKDAAKIRAFFIHPNFARQGLGTMLLNHCEHQALLNGFTHFEMMATLPGVKLYQTLGYEPVSNEVVVLPDNISMKFVRMSKRVDQIRIDKV